MLITKNDVGRKVWLRNENSGKILQFDMEDKNFPVLMGSGELELWCRTDGKNNIGERDCDIIAFAEDEGGFPIDPSKSDVSVIARAAEGKTLRDEFAMAALTGMLTASNHNTAPNDVIAGAAYALASAMMAAREGK